MKLMGALFLISQVFVSQSFGASKDDYRLNLPIQDIKYPNGAVLKLKDLQSEAVLFFKAKQAERALQMQALKIRGAKLSLFSKKMTPQYQTVFKKAGVNTADFDQKYAAIRKQFKPLDPKMYQTIQTQWLPFNLQIKKAFVAQGIASSAIRNGLLQIINPPMTSQPESDGDSGRTTLSWNPAIFAPMQPFGPFTQSFDVVWQSHFNFMFEVGDRGTADEQGHLFGAETVAFAGVDEHSGAGAGISVPVLTSASTVRATADVNYLESWASANSTIAGYASAETRLTLEVDEGDHVICTQALPLAGAHAVIWGYEYVENGISATDPEFPMPWNTVLECEGTRAATHTGVINAYVRVDAYAGAGGGAGADVMAEASLQRIRVLVH